MGMIQHEALLVTSFNNKVLEKTHKQAQKLFPKHSVSKITGSGMNGYKHFMVCPSGSKLEWELDVEHKAGLDKLISYIDSKTNEDGSNFIQYVRVSYGEFGADIEDANCT